MSQNEAILVVIPCLNEERYLQKIVESFLENNRDLPITLVIADGGSSDRTPLIAKDLAAKYEQVIFLQNEKKIQSSAVNLAVSRFGNGHRFLLRLDAHSDYPDNYLKVLLDEIHRTGASSVVVAMYSLGTGVFQKNVAFAQNSFLGNGGSAHRSAQNDGFEVKHGHHALMLLDVFLGLGGYDESFSHNEDAEFDFRLRQAGHRIWLTAKAVIVYHPRRTAKALFLQYIHYGKGRASMLLKHKIIPGFRQLAPTFVLPAFLLALATPLCFFALLPLLIWASVCLGFAFNLAWKNKSPSVLLSGPAAMIMHTGWSIGFWMALLGSLRKAKA